VIGQRLELDRAVLACRVVEPLRSANRATSPTSARIRAAPAGPSPEVRCGGEVAAGRPECWS